MTRPEPLSDVRKPIGVRRRRTKGWKMPPNTVSVTRPGPWSNPWTVKGAVAAGYRAVDAPQMCVDLFEEWLTGSEHSITRLIEGGEKRRAYILRHIAELRGKNLACFCALDQPCHRNVLLTLANAPLTPAKEPQP
jgi:Domain of unknown function (DUF4326)